MLQAHKPTDDGRRYFDSGEWSLAKQGTVSPGHVSAEDARLVAALPKALGPANLRALSTPRSSRQSLTGDSDKQADGAADQGGDAAAHGQEQQAPLHRAAHAALGSKREE